jgi:hypothetical protein
MKEQFTRRRVMMGAGGAAVVAAGVAGGRFLLKKRYAPSPYDDLLVRLEDRDAAAQIGETVLAEADDFDPKEVADDLRARLKDHSLANEMASDASEDRLVEAGGWVLPETLGLLCALAAKAAA